MKLIIASICILTLIHLSGTVSGQELSARQQKAYEKALLDSAYRFELMKPTFFNLKNAYEQKGKETEYLRSALRLSELQSELQKKEYETRLTAERRKRVKRAAVAGLTGLLIGLIVGL